jgi:hypothetical protein
LMEKILDIATKKHPEQVSGFPEWHIPIG